MGARNAAPAAGRSERMGGIDKVFAQLMGRPLLVWTLTAFKKCDEIDGIVIDHA